MTPTASYDHSTEGKGKHDYTELLSCKIGEEVE